MGMGQWDLASQRWRHANSRRHDGTAQLRQSAMLQPRHLWIGTQAESAADAKAEGRARGPVGARNKHTKLTPDQVLQMRRLFAAGEFGIVALGRCLGVRRDCILKLVKGDLWKHLPLAK